MDRNKIFRPFPVNVTLDKIEKFKEDLIHGFKTLTRCYLSNEFDEIHSFRITYGGGQVCQFITNMLFGIGW